MLKLLMMSAAAAAVLLGANDAGAFDMSPVVIEFDPSGSGAQKSFQIKNTQAETIAVQLSAFKRTQNPDGSDQLVPEDADFVIVPSQMVIAKGQT
jgi:fimbrial chaperone protein